MEHTSNYNLSQWAGEDRILREDFNADNAKIEYALSNLPKLKIGTYSGSGSELIPIQVNVGFYPIAVLIVGSGHDFSYSGTFVTRATPIMHLNTPLVKLTETGFIVNRAIYSNSPASPYTNEATSYTYLAIG